jgi:hypothetical protein
VPRPTFAVGYEGRMLEEGDEVELNEQDGKRLVEAGVLEETTKSRGGLERSRGLGVARSLFQLSVPARRTLNPALRHREGMITLLLPGRGCTPSREFLDHFYVARWSIFNRR